MNKTKVKIVKEGERQFEKALNKAIQELESQDFAIQDVKHTIGHAGVHYGLIMYYV